MVNLGQMLTRENDVDTHDVFPFPFIDKSNASTGIQRAVLTPSENGSHEPTLVK
jgi:hypothetical protein